MLTNFQQLYSRIVGDVPGIPLNRAKQCVQDAWRDINESRLWSFNVSESTLFVPNITNAGTVTVTYGSNTVTADSTAKTAWNAIGLVCPITVQQFRTSGQGVPNSGPVYNITAYDANGNITLDRPYGEATASGAGYTIYRLYYSVTPASGANFLCWESIMDPINGYTFQDTAMNKHDLDIIDPFRLSQSFPVYAAAVFPDANGNMLYEFWPAPVFQQELQTLYRTNGGSLVNDSDTLPPNASRALLEYRALYHALMWARINKHMMPNGGANLSFDASIREANAEYGRQYLRLSTQDEERMLSYWIKYRPQGGYVGLHTGDYLQNHDAFGYLTGF